MELSWFCVIYTVLCTVYLLIGVNRRRLWEKAILKCLPIILLLGLVLWSRSNYMTEESDKSNYQLLLFGLICSCVGDVLLVFHTTMAIFGMLSFAITQCIYIALFGLSVEQLLQLSVFGFVSGILVAVLSLSILALFAWQFNTILKRGDHGMRRRFIGLVMPVALVYFVLISLMLWSALLQLQDKVNIYSTLGGFLFYVSDILIAAGAIWRWRVLLHGRILVMLTYYGAQLLITLSVMGP